MTAFLRFGYSVAVSYCSLLRGDTFVFFWVGCFGDDWLCLS